MLKGFLLASNMISDQQKHFDIDQALISNLAGQGQELKSSSDTNPSLH